MLTRKTPLSRGAGLSAMSAKRRAALAEAGNANPFSTLVNSVRPSVSARKAPARRWMPAVPPETRAALVNRSGGWCEIQRPGCLGHGTDPSHRVTTKFGGRHGEAKVEHDRLSNVLWACRSCHDWIGTEPTAAKADGVGWALEEWQQPAAHPVLYRGRLVLLDDNGNVRPVTGAVA